MKITKDRLKQIIKEELEVSVGPSMSTASGEKPEEHNDADGHMAKSNLFKIIEYAHELYEMIGDDEDLEPWVEEKIAIAGYMMDSVAHYVRYEKHSEHESTEGEMDHLDVGDEEEHDMEGGEEGDEEYLDLGDDEEEYPEDEEEYENDEESDEQRYEEE